MIDYNDTVYNAKTPAEELGYYERIAGHYEEKLRGINYLGSELCFKALKEFEEKTGTFIPPQLVHTSII